MKTAPKLMYLLIAVCLTSTTALAQNANSGEIKGAVVDPNGAVVDGVIVTITNVRTGVKTSLTTNSSGLYDAPFVPTGEYTITFSKTGFREFIRQGIVLQVGTTTVDATLEVGTPSEQVVV